MKSTLIDHIFFSQCLTGRQNYIIGVFNVTLKPKAHSLQDSNSLFIVASSLCFTLGP